MYSPSAHLNKRKAVMSVALTSSLIALKGKKTKHESVKASCALILEISI